MTQNAVHPSGGPGDQQALALVQQLCQELMEEEIDYCHWKSNEAISRSARGDNDLDLLISRTDAARFSGILLRLGFHEVQEHTDSKLPGVLNYYGYDAPSDRIIHVHVHYQLVLGNDLSKNYRIPIEQAYLDSAAQVGWFRLPAPEFELVVFILRMVLKHSTWDAILMRQGALSWSERHELEYLGTGENLEKAKKVLAEHLPYVDQALFDACVQVLQPGTSLLKRVLTGNQLQMALAACARHSNATDLAAKFSRQLWLLVRIGILHRKSKRHLANGGLLIAVVGGDGSGKTTVVDGLHGWLSPKFDVMKLHMGKPKWSWTTIVVRGLLKIGTLLGFYSFEEYTCNEARFHGYPWLIRAVCVARDRYLAYLKARRFTSNGGLVISDRYPLPNLLDMDAPQAARVRKLISKPNRFLRWLTRIEVSFYRQISPPDRLIVLRLSPEIAVQRKPDENSVSVRTRSTLVWRLDWSKIPAYVLDAGLPKDEVLAQVKSIVWDNL